MDKEKKVKIWFDGACINNHIKDIEKRKTYGCYIIEENNLEQEHIFLSEAHSSNQAEYDALIKALEYVQHQLYFNDKEYEIIGDSQTIVNHINGNY